ncbi:hypothetical protein [Pyxidicoccus sp. MSG2]|uniref:hypothetical protein n=1 Tax=Pyxidicoccus sp. MSG2 TaxID=2996790 RepID=UPI00226E3C05|nr:hypothetical protein [Pyxidicoccus sp. MSG2]MCY1023762.1 hypothetical protein [Pyxidicoccus sp. MSG2]
MNDEDDTPAHLYEEKVVSLNLELANLEHALHGAQLLAELLANNDMPTAEADRQAPRSVVAILALADARRRIRTTDDVPQGLEGMSKSGHPLSGAEES